MTRALARSFVLVAVLFGAVGGTTAVATDAHAKPEPTAVTISGEGLAEPMTVRADTDPVLFAAVLDQVSWLRGGGHPAPQEGEDLGPKYTVVILVDDAPTETYDLYPLAAGGPRAFRPANQPDKRKTKAAWFYGRLNMPETLRAVGAPLPAEHDGLGGGFTAGDPDASAVVPDAGEKLGGLMADLRRLLLLDAAVVLAIALGLAGASVLLRRRTR
jgi:hypothetical protein